MTKYIKKPTIVENAEAPNADTQLKQALAKMLPEKIETNVFPCAINWRQAMWGGKEVLDTELLHLCWLVEETMTDTEWLKYQTELKPTYQRHRSNTHSTWQQRIIALSKVKGVEIV